MPAARYNLSVLILSALLFSCANADSSIEGSAFTFFSTNAVQSKKKIISVISESSESLFVCAPLINDAEIVAALISAKSDFTEIEVVVDNMSLALPGTKKLINSGISVHPRATDAFMGSFFIISDRKKLITGSVDLNITSENNICLAAVFNDKIMADNFYREFYILRTGQSPISKDTEFDIRLGPFGKQYDPGWYSDNQILLDDGSIKGRWGADEVFIYGSRIKTFFTPYSRSTRDYKCYSLNAYSTYSLSSVDYTYTNQETGTVISEPRTDIINVIAPMLESAEVSIKIFASLLTEKVIINEVLKAGLRGIKTEIYLDYDMTLNLRNQNSSTLKALMNNTNTIFLYRPDSGGSLSLNLIQIDNSAIIIDSAGFTPGSFTKNDSSILIIKDNLNLDNELKRAATEIKAHSIVYNPDTDYTGQYEICDYKEDL